MVSFQKFGEFVPGMLPIKMDYAMVRQALEKGKKTKKWVLIFVIGTKPCFYKFYGAIQAAHKNDLPYLIINANQHYDDILTFGINEFDLTEKISINLEIRGDLAQKSAELYLKCSWLARKMQKDYPDVTTVPIVLGDTILAGIVPSAWMFAVRTKSINIEAGLRSMTPTATRKLSFLKIEDYLKEQRHGQWELARNEPFPEQWDTFVSSAACEFHFAPIELNKNHLIREGYPTDNIFVIGNPVMDAVHLKLAQKPKKSVFEAYPQLEKGEWIRVDIHRRENLTLQRLKSIVHAVKKLVERGHKINFVQMLATKEAFNSYGLKDAFEGLKNNPNFLFTDLWPEYGHVVEFYNSQHCLAALTDSGGVQEDMNVMKKMCLTARFSTDRPETANQSMGNVIVPPFNADFMANMVHHVVNDEHARKLAASQKPLYGKDVGQKFIGIVEKLIKSKNKPFKWTHESLGLWQDEDEGVKYL